MTRTVVGRRRLAIGLAVAYRKFNADNQLTPSEVGGEELRGQWTGSLDEYRRVTEQYGIRLGRAR